MVDAARGELIGSVRFRRWKWCSTNTGSNPVLTTDGTNPETLKDKVGDNWKDNNMGLQARGFQGGRQPKWGFESPALTIFLIIQPVDPGGLSD
jgi:hypothetical protein